MSGLLGEIKCMMVHLIHKTLNGWNIQLSVSSCCNWKENLHKHQCKSMLYFFVFGVNKQCCTFLGEKKLSIIVITLLGVVMHFVGLHGDASSQSKLRSHDCTMCMPFSCNDVKRNIKFLQNFSVGTS